MERIVTGGTWDKAWGGGFVPMTTTLIGGSAGMGKTTVLFQIASIVAHITGKWVYFISAEQAKEEIKLTVERLQIPNIERFVVLKEFGAGADIAEDLLKEKPPACFVLDSISALCGKDVHAALAIVKQYKKLAVKYKAPAFIICHMNKSGDYGGLYSLQHEVDTLVTLFGPQDDNHEAKLHELHRAGHSIETLESIRFLRAWKNRYGATNEDHLLVMTAHGLEPLPELAAPEGRKRRARSVREMLGLKASSEQAQGAQPLEQAPEQAPAPQARVEAPEAIEGPGGQRLVRVKRKKHEKPQRAEAIEGEALKKRRPAMPRTAEGKKAARERRGTRHAE